jgi:hypothetical protein
MDDVLEYLMPFLPLVGYGILSVFIIFLLYKYTRTYRLLPQEPPQSDLEDPPYFILE